MRIHNLKNKGICSACPKFYQRKLVEGFTLIETLIYAALISIIISLVLGAVYQIIESSSKLNEQTTIEGEASFVLRKIKWALTGVSAINLPVAGGNGSTLSVNKYNYSYNPLVFELQSNRVYSKKAGENSFPLNNQNTTVTNLNFQNIAAVDGAPPGIKTTLTINGRQFETTIYLKK